MLISVSVSELALIYVTQKELDQEQEKEARKSQNSEASSFFYDYGIPKEQHLDILESANKARIASDKINQHLYNKKHRSKKRDSATSKAMVRLSEIKATIAEMGETFLEKFGYAKPVETIGQTQVLAQRFAKRARLKSQLRVSTESASTTDVPVHVNVNISNIGKPVQLPEVKMTRPTLSTKGHVDSDTEEPTGSSNVEASSHRRGSESGTYSSIVSGLTEAELLSDQRKADTTQYYQYLTEHVFGKEQKSAVTKLEEMRKAREEKRNDRVSKLIEMIRKSKEEKQE